MAIIRCDKGHIYNSEQYSSCPTCSSMGYRIEFGRGAGHTEAFSGNMGITAGGVQDVGKTIGFDNIPHSGDPEDFGKTMAAGLGNMTVRKDAHRPVTGWLICIKGSTAGKSYEIHSDYNYIGSEKGDVVIPGDNKISRENHMMITYDPQDRIFYISPASGANIIRHKGKALVGSAVLEDYDMIETGDSKFMFISFCGEKFDWEDLENERSKA